MLSKKLVTLGGALGILACGACFVPPQRPYHPPPAPPPPASLRGIRTIAVQVSNDSESRHLPAAELAAMVARNIGLLGSEPHITATTDGAADPDARLGIEIRRETATPQPVDLNWAIVIEASSTLTARDGRVLWSEARSYTTARRFPAQDPEQVWQNSQIRTWLAWTLANRMMHPQ